MQVVNDKGEVVQFARQDRRCPRCHAHRMHHASRTKGKKGIHIVCAECGHDWDGRYRKDEWDDWRELMAWEKEQLKGKEP